MSTYSEAAMVTPTPKDLAGYQQVENGEIEEWDLLIPVFSPEQNKWRWADEYLTVGVPIKAFLSQYRVYRKMPCPHAGDNDKVPGTDKTYGELRGFDIGAPPDKRYETPAPKVGAFVPDNGKPAAFIPNAGEKHAFDSGAHRDKQVGKGEFVCIPPDALRALAKRYEDGAKLYGRDNWHKGFPLSSFYNSAMRHLLAIAEGKDDEDHAGAVLWNVCGMIHTNAQIKAGKLPATLDDLPYRRHEAQ